MITIDGSFGEGGGQMLRTSIALSLLYNKEFRIINIRAKREKPGLLRQHLTAVAAAQEIGSATVSGNAIGSMELTFSPGKIRPGKYTFRVGTAGSATLVLQTVLPALLCSDDVSSLTLEGGTHNPFAPPYDFLAESFFPALKLMGACISSEIDRYGFYPAGGGSFRVEVKPSTSLTPIELTERGKQSSLVAKAYYAHIPASIAASELDLLSRKLRIDQLSCTPHEVPSTGPGNSLVLFSEFENARFVCTGFGEKRIPLSVVSESVVTAASYYLSSGAAVCEHLADQLLIPMVIAGGGCFTTTEPTQHTRTNIDVIQKFVDISIHTEQLSDVVWKITVGEGK